MRPNELEESLFVRCIIKNEGQETHREGAKKDQGIPAQERTPVEEKPTCEAGNEGNESNRTKPKSQSRCKAKKKEKNRFSPPVEELVKREKHGHGEKDWLGIGGARRPQRKDCEHSRRKQKEGGNPKSDLIVKKSFEEMKREQEDSKRKKKGDKLEGKKNRTQEDIKRDCQYTDPK